MSTWVCLMWSIMCTLARARAKPMLSLKGGGDDPDHCVDEACGVQQQDSPLSTFICVMTFVLPKGGEHEPGDAGDVEQVVVAGEGSIPRGSATVGH